MLNRVGDHLCSDQPSLSPTQAGPPPISLCYQTTRPKGMQVDCEPKRVSTTTHPISSKIINGQHFTIRSCPADNWGPRLLPVGRGGLGEFGRILYSPFGRDGAVRTFITSSFVTFEYWQDSSGSDSAGRWGRTPRRVNRLCADGINTANRLIYILAAEATTVDIEHTEQGAPPRSNS